MKMQTHSMKISYFGKIPSRGDFVKATDNSPLIQLLDQWLTQSMELLANDPRWKLSYDSIAPISFAIVGPASRTAIAGHLRASQDSSQRRFPFLAAGTIDAEQPASLTMWSPLVIGRVWARLQEMVTGIVEATDAAPLMHALAGTSLELDTSAVGYRSGFEDFLSLITIGQLQGLLEAAGFQGSVRQLMLALGLLLKPVMSTRSSRLDKNLVLPLPLDPFYRNLVATLWMHLITPFLVHANFEIVIFTTEINGQPRMITGFNGAASRTLHAVIDPRASAENNITFDNAEWVEAPASQQPRIQTLDTRLVRNRLSLKAAFDSFHAAFISP